MSAVRRAIAGLGALIVLAALLVGVPVALAVVVGWPLPHSWPTFTEIQTLLETSGIPDIVLIDALAIVCWIAWIDFALATCLEALAAARGRAASRPLLARPWQAIAARLVTTVVVAVVLLSSRPPISQPARGAALSSALAADKPLARAEPLTSTRVTAATVPPTTTATPPYVVRGGDTLWGISGQRLGDPRRWTDVWRRNRERAEPHGRRFTNPNLIVPGWTLDVPAAHDGTTSVRPGPTPLSPTASPATPPATPAPSPAGSGAPPSEGPSRPPTTPDPRSAPSPPPANLRPRAELSSPTVALPSGGVVGLAFAAGIVAGLGAARLHERRRRRIGSGDRSAVDGLVGPTVRHLRSALTASRPTDDDEPQVHPTAAMQALDIIDEWRSHPGPTPAGVTQDGVSDAIIDVVDLSGRALTGPGAERAAQALVTAAVAGPTVDTDLLLIGGTERFLCGVETIPGVERIDTVSVALAWLEAECVRREHVLRGQGATDYRAIATSSDPLGTLLVIAHGPEVAHGAADFKRLVDRGRRLGISVVIIDSAPGFDPLEVTEDGSINNRAGTPAVSERLFSLSKSETAELLAVARAGRGAPVEAVETPSAATDLERAAVAIPGPVTPHPRPVHVLLFGPPRIEANGAEVATGLREAARELLFLLALHRQGLRQEEALAEMWPDAEDEHIGTFRVAVTSTRRRLRELCGDGGQFIVLTTTRYVLDPNVIDCDVWRFDAAVTRGSRESDLAARRTAMSEAAELVTGEPLAGAAYEWAEPLRESLRRRAIDLLGELAALLGAEGDLAGSISALERARAVDPYCEDVYRRLMQHLADMGRDDVALRVYRELERYAATLGTGPDADTEALMVALRARSAAHNLPRTVEADQAAELDDEGDREDGHEATAARMTIVGKRRASQPQPGSLSSAVMRQPTLPILDEDGPRSV